MDRDGIKAAAAQVRSTIKQAIARVRGDAETRTEGAADTPAAEAESIRKRSRRTPRDPAKE